MKKYFNFLLAIVLCLIIGFLGSTVTTPSIPNWYQTLNKPFFNPPDWIFAPVWTLLYIFMGTSLALILNLQTKNEKAKKGIYVFGIQLFLNLTWSVVFFGFHLPWLAFLIIILLWVMILLTIINFYHLSKTAGILLLPYLFWVSFASILNLAIVYLNP